MKPRGAAACGLAALGLLHGAGASAADTAWTGSAGPSQSFWDLAANWSAGLPMSATTRALLGAFDTTLRSGSFEVSSVGGSGTLTITGGELRVAGSSSYLQRLDLRGGSVIGTGPGAGLSLGDLRTEAGTELRGFDHVIATGTVFNGGRHVKSGIGDGSFSAGAFENAGSILVEGGVMDLSANVGGEWTNSGSIVIEGGSTTISLFRGSGNLTQAGTIDLRAGQLRVDSLWTELVSTGTWSVAAGARMDLNGSRFDPFGRDRPLHFDAGSFYNAGHLRVNGGVVTFAVGTTLHGPGTIEVVNAASLSFPGNVSIGGLRVADPFNLNGVPVYSSVGFGGGPLTLGTLDWADGDLHLGGPLTVNGLATLTLDTLEQDVDTFDFHRVGKRIDVPVAFNGGVRWDGEADIHGTGTIAVAAGTVFEDRTARNALAVDPDTGQQLSRPIRIDVASFDNAGTYLKNGAGPTMVAGPFRNTGTVRAVDAGLLTFAGPMDNLGTLEAVRSRVVVFGSLAQADGRTLSGGRYIARDSTLVLNLGGDLGGTRATLVHANDADITLDGPQARLRTTWLGMEYDALSELAINRGRLALANGAALALGAALRNTGVLEIDGARLAVTRYDQEDAAAATWIDGLLESTYAGSWSARWASIRRMPWVRRT